MNSFLESQDFSGKKIVLFATSGGSGFGKAVKSLMPSCPGAEITEGRVFREDFAESEVLEWVQGFKTE